ncbi:MAG: hypothetical protein ACREA2_09820 [Blastocatellia bacterium]
MKRVIFLCSLTFIFSVGQALVRPGWEQTLGAENVGRPDGGQTKVRPTLKTCPFSIIGMWKVEGRTEADSLFYSFSPEGWVRVVSRSADALPREYEVMAEVKYELDRPTVPKRIEFITRRGNDAFPAGKTSLVMVEYGDDSFVTENPKTRALTRWVRAQTHRYFLTFAARGGPALSAFAMWTTLDGRQTKVEALGLRMENRDGAAPSFGPIPDRLYREFEIEGRKASNVMLRLELTEAEFERSHKVFEAWAEFVRIAKLPHDDPYLNGMEFLKSAAGNLNQCEEKLKLPATDGVTSARNPHQQALEYIKEMSKKNKSLHVTDGIFPTDWRPMQFSDG